MRKLSSDTSEITHPNSPSDIEEEFEKKQGSFDNLDHLLVKVNTVKSKAHLSLNENNLVTR